MTVFSGVSEMDRVDEFYGDEAGDGFPAFYMDETNFLDDERFVGSREDDYDYIGFVDNVYEDFYP